MFKLFCFFCVARETWAAHALKCFQRNFSESSVEAVTADSFSAAAAAAGEESADWKSELSLASSVVEATTGGPPFTTVLPTLEAEATEAAAAAVAAGPWIGDTAR